jgi:hypothetical protein
MNPERTAFLMPGTVADQLIDLQLQRHAWLSTASRQVRQWKEEDARNGQPWGEENNPREAGVANNAPAAHSR